MPEIRVEFPPDGSVVINAVGFTGTDCEKATAFLEQALGNVSQRRRKPEYWSSTQRNAARNRQKAGGQ